MKKKNNSLKIVIVGVAIIIALAFLYALIPKQEGIKQDIPESQNKVVLSFGKYNYEPQVIRAKVNEPITIEADMQRIKGCYRAIQIPAFNIRKVLTETDNKITFIPDKKGTFSFSCFMNMGTGTLIVE